VKLTKPNTLKCATSILQLDHVSFGVIPSSLFDEFMFKVIVTISPHKYLGNS
jgi:hypothetical protein